MSETQGISPEEVLGFQGSQEKSPQVATQPVPAEVAHDVGSPATGADDHATYDPTIEANYAQQTRLEATRQAEADLTAMSEIADKCIIQSGEVWSLGQELYVLTLLRRTDSASNPALLVSIAKILETVQTVRGDEQSLATFPGGAKALDAVVQTVTKWQQEMVATAKDSLVREVNVVGTNSDLLNQLNSLSLTSSEEEVIAVAHSLQDALSVAPSVPSGTPATERASLVLRQMFPHLDNQLRAIATGGNQERRTEAEKPANSREEEMNNIADALTAAYDKDLVTAGLLDPDETKVITEAVKKAGIENPKLTQGDLRVEALKALRAVVNARSDKSDRMTSWNAQRYTNFTKAETQALNAVFGAKTHDARLGIVYPDGRVVKPDGNYKKWEKEVEKLQKIDDPSVRFESPSTATPTSAEISDVTEDVLDKELRGAMDGAKIMALFSEEQWSMARKLCKDKASDAMTALATIVSKNGLPTNEAESLTLRVAFVNAITGRDGSDLITEVDDIVPQLLSSENAERQAEIVPITHEQVMLTKWLDSIFGSTDTLLFWDDESKKIVAKDAFSSDHEDENVRHYLRVLRGMRQTLLGFGSRAGTLVEFNNSLVSKARSLPRDWKPGRPQPFEVTRNVTPEQAAEVIAS